MQDVTTFPPRVQGGSRHGNASTSGAFDKRMANVLSAELALRGAGGEPVDLRRTISSHGVADLPPNRIDEEAWTLELTLPVDGKAPRTVQVSEGRPGHAKREPGPIGLQA